MEKVSYLVSYESLSQSFVTEIREEAFHAFGEGAKVLEIREYRIAFDKTMIEIRVTRAW